MQLPWMTDADCALWDLVCAGMNWAVARALINRIEEDWIIIKREKVVLMSGK